MAFIEEKKIRQGGAYFLHHCSVNCLETFTDKKKFPFQSKNGYKNLIFVSTSQ